MRLKGINNMEEGNKYLPEFIEIFNQIQTERPAYAMRHASVTVQKSSAGTIRITYKEKSLAYMIVKEQPKADIIDSKHLNAAVDRLAARIGIPILVTEQPYYKPVVN